MLLTTLFAIRLILDSFFNSRTDQPENQANNSQSLLPKKSTCPPSPPPPPPMKSVPLQQSAQDVLVEGTTFAPQPKTLAEELQSVQLRIRKMPSFTGSHSMSSGYSGSSGLSEAIISAVSMQQLVADQSDVKGACPPPPPPPPPVKSVPLQQSSQDVLVEGTTSAPQLKTLAEELQSVQLRKVPSFTGSHSTSSGYFGSSRLSEVIASAMTMRRCFIAQSDDEDDDDAVDSNWED